LTQPHVIAVTKLYKIHQPPRKPFADFKYLILINKLGVSVNINLILRGGIL